MVPCSYFLPCTNTNSKWIKDLKVRSKILKLLVENLSETPQDIGTGKAFSENNSSILRTILKNWQMGLCKIRLLYKNINNHQIEETTYRMGKPLNKCKSNRDSIYNL